MSLRMQIDKLTGQPYDKLVKFQMVLLSELMNTRPKLNPNSMKFLNKLKAFSKALDIAAKERKEKERLEELRRNEKENQSNGYSHSEAPRRSSVQDSEDSQESQKDGKMS